MIVKVALTGISVAFVMSLSGGSVSESRSVPMEQQDWSIFGAPPRESQCLEECYDVYESDVQECQDTIPNPNDRPPCYSSAMDRYSRCRKTC